MIWKRGRWKHTKASKTQEWRAYSLISWWLCIFDLRAKGIHVDTLRPHEGTVCSKKKLIRIQNESLQIKSASKNFTARWVAKVVAARSTMILGILQVDSFLKMGLLPSAHFKQGWYFLPDRLKFNRWRPEIPFRPTQHADRPSTGYAKAIQVPVPPLLFFQFFSLSIWNLSRCHSHSCPASPNSHGNLKF